MNLLKTFHYEQLQNGWVYKNVTKDLFIQIIFTLALLYFFIKIIFINSKNSFFLYQFAILFLWSEQDGSRNNFLFHSPNKHLSNSKKLASLEFLSGWNSSTTGLVDVSQIMVLNVNCMCAETAVKMFYAAGIGAQ